MIKELCEFIHPQLPSRCNLLVACLFFSFINSFHGVRQSHVGMYTGYIGPV
jgi:hypothetical protein